MLIISRMLASDQLESETSDGPAGILRWQKAGQKVQQTWWFGVETVEMLNFGFGLDA